MILAERPGENKEEMKTDLGIIGNGQNLKMKLSCRVFAVLRLEKYAD
jgi:hypothetical protein